MSATILVGIATLAVVICAGALLTVRAPALSLPGWLTSVSQRGRATVTANVRLIGRPMTALHTGLAGIAAIVVVSWWLGKIAHALQGPVDWPVFRWFEDRQVSWWSDIWLVLTDIGSPTVTQRLALVAAVFYALAWRRQNWWAPAITLAGAYVFEKYAQIVLKLVVDRGHPPTTLGTFPSGGCARVLVIYGLVVFLFLRWRQNTNRRTAWLGASVVAFLLTVQAYARTYNLEHWITDVIGGIVYGALLLGLMMLVFDILDGRLDHQESDELSGALSGQPVRDV